MTSCRVFVIKNKQNQVTQVNANSSFNNPLSNLCPYSSLSRTYLSSGEIEWSDYFKNLSVETKQKWGRQLPFKSQQ